MRKLTQPEIDTFAKALSFSYGEAEEITDLFYNEKSKNHYPFKNNPLESADDYINAWEWSFYRYYSWKSLVESEYEQPEGMTEEECKEALNKCIFELPCGLFVQWV